MTVGRRAGQEPAPARRKANKATGQQRLPRSVAEYHFAGTINRRADMNPFTLLFRLPLMPLRSVIQLGETLHKQAEQELHDPASIRRQLEQAERAHAAGKISDEELARVQAQAVDRLRR